MATQNDDSTEVKETSDGELDGVLTANDLEDPNSDDLGNAVVEDPENKPAEEEKETPAEPSTEEKPAESDEPGTPPDSEETETGEADGDEPEGSEKTEDKKPKEVPGETPRENALRQEVERVKRKLRVERGQKMFSDVPVTAATDDLSDEDKTVLEGFDPEQVANMEKLIAIQAKKMGFVKKDEFSKQTYQDQAQATLDDFLENHPEYDEKNDPDGLLWKRFGQEYAQYKAPQNPRELTKIFNRVHKELFGIETDSKGLKEVEAKKEKIKIASHAASAGGSSKSTESKIDPETKQLAGSGAMKGFSDEDLKEFGLK